MFILKTLHPPSCFLLFNYCSKLQVTLKRVASVHLYSSNRIQGDHAKTTVDIG